MFGKFKPEFNLSEFLIKAAVVGFLAFVSLCGYLMVQALLGYEVVSIVIVGYFVYRLLRTAGLIVMYPGSFGYFKGVLESSYSNTWKRNLEAIIRAMRKDLSKGREEIEDIAQYTEALRFFRTTVVKYEKKMTERRQQFVRLIQEIIEDQ